VSTEKEREVMAREILDYEARRDAQGRLEIYRLPPDDGGGAFEVGGINERHHPEEARHLADLINAGRHEAAEITAREFIATYTDFVARWTGATAIEFFVRDCAFNRGRGGAARILQRALGVEEDGFVGRNTLAAVTVQEQSPATLLRALRAAREAYEREVVKRDESSRFWRGLVNRWNKAMRFSEAFLPTATVTPAIAIVETPFVAAQAAVENAIAAGEKSEPGPNGARLTLYGDGVHPAAREAPGLEMAAAAFAGLGALDALSLGPVHAPVVLKALRIGSQGDLVYAWQSFLAGQGFSPGGLDGHFSDKTAAATRAFQKHHNLAADGIAGRQTLQAAMTLGFELIEEPSADTTGSNFPPRPDYPPLVGTQARQALFGAFGFVHEPQPRNLENIRILGTWVQDNIVTVPVPQLRAALGSSAPAGMRFHRLAAEQLKALWAEWEAAGLLSRVLTFQGAFMPRFVRRSTTTLSNHAFGTAFDINSKWNDLGVRPALVGEIGSVRELVPIANRHGFYWGGHFGRRPDGMHFEIAHLLPSPGMAVASVPASTAADETALDIG
jgi:lysozyme family protein/peptidoglycan hydrolase-like protein with peptidoglycan-binding domain